MSHDRPVCRGSTVAARARNSSMSRPSIGRVRLSRQAGRARTGSRSMRRTRKRNERERAPMTIEARSATDSGAAASRICSTASRDAEVPRRRRAGGHEPAEVDDAPHAGGGRGGGEALGGACAPGRRSRRRSPAPWSGSGSRRPRRRRAPRSRPAPVIASPSTTSSTSARRRAPRSGRSRGRRGRRAAGAARGPRRRIRSRR